MPWKTQVSAASIASLEPEKYQTPGADKFMDELV